MRCTSCNKRIESPIEFCPQCGAKIPEADREQLRNEIKMQAAADAETLRKWKKYVALAIVEVLVGAIIVFPLFLYVSLRFNLMWLMAVFAVLWIFGFIYLGFIKGGFKCPFCGNILGNIAGSKCPHCSKKIK